MTKEEREIIVYTDGTMKARAFAFVEVDSHGEWLSPDQLDLLRARRGSVLDYIEGGTPDMSAITTEFDMPAGTSTEESSEVGAAFYRVSASPTLSGAV